MSKMSEMAQEIENLFIEGVSIGEIARSLNIPVKMVSDHLGEIFNVAEDREIVEGWDNYRDYDDSMDGDAASALASAGWGTDEDYGGFDDSF